MDLEQQNVTSQLVREVCVCAKPLQSCLTLCDPVRQDTLFMGFSRPEEGSGWPRPSPGDLSDSGIEPVSLKSAALVGRFSTTRQPGGLFVKTDCGPHSHVLPQIIPIMAHPHCTDGIELRF